MSFQREHISQNETDKVVQFVNNTIEVHKSVITPVGSLKNRLNEWRLMIHNQYILDIIENGYEWLKYAVLKQNQHKCIFIAINHHLRTKIVLLLKLLIY